MSIDPLSDTLAGKSQNSEMNLWKFFMNSTVPASLNPSAGLCLVGTTEVVLQSWIFFSSLC